MDDMYEKMIGEFQDNLSKAGASLNDLHSTMTEFHKTRETNEEKDMEELSEELKDDAEDVVEEVPVISGEFVIDINDFKDDKVFKTSEVADLCNLTSQNVRNLLKTWEPLIQPKRDDGGNILWSKGNVLRMRELLLIRKEFNLSTKGVLDYYTKPTTEMLGNAPAASPVQMQQMIDDFSQKMEEQLNAKLATFGQAMTMMVESSLRPVLEVKDQLKLEDQEEKKKQIEAQTQTMNDILGIVKELKQRDEEREKELQSLREENEKLKAEQTPKKKFLGIFG